MIDEDSTRDAVFSRIGRRSAPARPDAPSPTASVSPELRATMDGSPLLQRLKVVCSYLYLSETSNKPNPQHSHQDAIQWEIQAFWRLLSYLRQTDAVADIIETVKADKFGVGEESSNMTEGDVIRAAFVESRLLRSLLGLLRWLRWIIRTAPGAESRVDLLFKHKGNIGFEETRLTYENEQNVMNVSKEPFYHLDWGSHVASNRAIRNNGSRIPPKARDHQRSEAFFRAMYHLLMRGDMQGVIQISKQANEPWIEAMLSGREPYLDPFTPACVSADHAIVGIPDSLLCLGHDGTAHTDLSSAVDFSDWTELVAVIAVGYTVDSDADQMDETGRCAEYFSDGNIWRPCFAKYCKAVAESPVPAMGMYEKAVYGFLGGSSKGMHAACGADWALQMVAKVIEIKDKVVGSLVHVLRSKLNHGKLGGEFDAQVAKSIFSVPSYMSHADADDCIEFLDRGEMKRVSILELESDPVSHSAFLRSIFEGCSEYRFPSPSLCDVGKAIMGAHCYPVGETSRLLDTVKALTVPPGSAESIAFSEFGAHLAICLQEEYQIVQNAQTELGGDVEMFPDDPMGGSIRQMEMGLMSEGPSEEQIDDHLIAYVSSLVNHPPPRLGSSVTNQQRTSTQIVFEHIRLMSEDKQVDMIFEFLQSKFKKSDMTVSQISMSQDFQYCIYQMVSKFPHTVFSILFKACKDSYNTLTSNIEDNEIPSAIREACFTIVLIVSTFQYLHTHDFYNPLNKPYEALKTILIHEDPGAVEDPYGDVLNILQSDTASEVLMGVTCVQLVCTILLPLLLFEPIQLAGDMKGNPTGASQTATVISNVRNGLYLPLLAKIGALKAPTGTTDPPADAHVHNMGLDKMIANLSGMFKFEIQTDEDTHVTRMPMEPVVCMRSIVDMMNLTATFDAWVYEGLRVADAAVNEDPYVQQIVTGFENACDNLSTSIDEWAVMSKIMFFPFPDELKRYPWDFDRGLKDFVTQPDIIPHKDDLAEARSAVLYRFICSLVVNIAQVHRYIDAKCGEGCDELMKAAEAIECLQTRVKSILSASPNISSVLTKDAGCRMLTTVIHGKAYVGEPISDIQR
eukprot:GHVO01023141.1.p1 GENE.GHVO01023141.1~~GHVO01023141.1.p1  ORF type:complete len:1077 (+),score=270.79 GHVO01023141.1:849-4079(+)